MLTLFDVAAGLRRLPIHQTRQKPLAWEIREAAADVSHYDRGSRKKPRLAESRIRQETGCNIVAVIQGNQIDTNPSPKMPLPAGSELIVVGDTEAESRFFDRWHAH